MTFLVLKYVTGQRSGTMGNPTKVIPSPGAPSLVTTLLWGLVGPRVHLKEMLDSGRQGCPNTDAAGGGTQYVPTNIDPSSSPKSGHHQTMPGHIGGSGT